MNTKATESTPAPDQAFTPFHLRIHTLGPFRIEWVDPATAQIIPFPAERLSGQNAANALALFQALLSKPGRFATRSWLLEQFWPNSPLHSAEERLNDVASSLRCLLRAEGDKSSLVHFVHGNDKRGAGYRLEGYPRIWCDADAFEWYVDHALLLEQRGQDATACWERAYAFSQRGEYLPERIEEDWSRVRRDALQGLQRDCVQHWTQQLRQAGQVDEAILRLRSYWLEHPTDEDALRPLLEMLGERERFGEAEAYYAKACEALAEDKHAPDDRTNETIETVRAMQVKRPPSWSPSDQATISAPAWQKMLVSSTDQKRIIEAVASLVEEQELNPDRRRLLQQMFQLAGTAALPIVALCTSAKKTYRERISQETVVLYEQVLALSWEHYYTSSARYAAQHVAGWLQSLLDLLPSAPREDQKLLLSLLCRFYQLSGVAARDRMDLSQARSDGKVAIELAFHLEDAELIAASLFRQAKTLLKQRCTQEALEHLEAACIYAQRTRDPLKGYIYQATAEASALFAPQDTFRQQQTLHLLDRAEQVLEAGNLEDDGSFVKLSRAGLALDRANALLHFRAFQAAHSYLDHARTHLEADLTRWHTRLLLAEAQIYLAEQAPEACCEKIMEALHILQTTQSQSGMWRVSSLYQQLSTTYAQHALVQALGERLLDGK